ncbi:MAG TPA: 16S rRNA (uracil(1498)-N(3))-methyltransferase [Pseudonocardiaceae bacterium]|nr:16S rRNA (uracil(1498)-N(3))-methyltransferase [Pseudonocardiaceae bacterium]
MTSLPVFLVDELPVGDAFVLDGPEGRHAASARRLRSGEELVVSDGRGGLATCRVDKAERDTVALTVLDREQRPRPGLTVTLVQALVKGERGELAVELATEAGVDDVLPWRAERCVARWEDGPRGAKALARWQSTVREAAKQARRPWCPAVADPVSTARLLDRIGRAAATLVLHESAAARLPEVKLPVDGELLLVVGPEGGISDAELAAFVAAGATPVRLGPAVLRASTAGAVALGAIGALTQRWQ